MINKALFELTAGLPCRLIKIKGRPYLERYYLGKLFGYTFYLHRFVSGDPEPHIHNHPWKWGASLILSGSYIEEKMTDLCPSQEGSGCLTIKRTKRWFSIVNGSTFHRVYCAEHGTWTLFAHSKRTTGKGWGFLERKYIPGLHEVTMFIPKYPKADKWWVSSPKGATAGRVSL